MRFTAADNLQHLAGQFGIEGLIHGIPVTILRGSGGFDLLVPRSFSASLLYWIEDAAEGLREPLGSTA